MCSKCENLIRAGRAVEEQKGRKEAKGRIVVLCAEWPPIQVYGAPEIARKLEGAMRELAKCALTPVPAPHVRYERDLPKVPPHHGRTYFTTDPSGETYWKAPKRTTDAITALDDALREALRAIYEEGKREGSNLLMQLAKGEISVRELSDAHIHG